MPVLEPFLFLCTDWLLQRGLHPSRLYWVLVQAKQIHCWPEPLLGKLGELSLWGHPKSSGAFPSCTGLSWGQSCGSRSPSLTSSLCLQPTLESLRCDTCSEETSGHHRRLIWSLTSPGRKHRPRVPNRAEPSRLFICLLERIYIFGTYYSAWSS